MPKRTHVPSEDAIFGRDEHKLTPEAAALMRYSEEDMDHAVSIVEARHARAAAAATAAMEAHAPKTSRNEQMLKDYGLDKGSGVPQLGDELGLKGGGGGGGGGGHKFAGQPLPSRASSAAPTRGLTDSHSVPNLPAAAAPYHQHPMGTLDSLSRPSTAMTQTASSSAIGSASVTPAVSAVVSAAPSRPATGQRLIRNQPQRPGSATRLPALDVEHAPAVAAAWGTPPGPVGAVAEPPHETPETRELRALRRRSAELEVELRSVKNVAAGYRSRLQAFSDSLRSSGLAVPSDSDAAFYAEAAALLQGAIERQYGGRVSRQQLAPAELRNVRTRFEQQAQQASAMHEHAGVERQRLEEEGLRYKAQLEHAQGELRKLQEQTRLMRLKEEERASIEAKEAAEGAGGGKGRGHRGANGFHAPAAAPKEPMISVAEHEAKLREVQATHAKALQAEVDKASAAADARSRAALSQTQSSSAAQLAGMESRLAEAEAAALQHAKELEAKAKAERVDLFMRQFARRMQNVQMTRGWAAWVARWEAKTYALERLKQSGNRLRAPALANAFDQWLFVAAAARQEAERRAALKTNQTLEGQLRYAQYELSQMSMLNTAHEDELKGLHERVAALAADAKKDAEAVASAKATEQELRELKEAYKEAMAEAEEVSQRAAQVEVEAHDRREGNEALLKRLLAEQRAAFDVEMGEMRAKLHEKTEAQKREARIEALRKSATRRIKYRDVSRGMDAWREMYEARKDAQHTLKRLAGHAPLKGLLGAFSRWAQMWRSRTAFLREMTAEQQLATAEMLQSEVDRLSEQCASVASERDALAKKLYEISGGAVAMEESTRRLLEQQEAAERERRVELLGKQAGRRLLHEGLRRGFTAWRDQHEARARAMASLQTTARRLRNRVVWSAWSGWAEYVSARRAAIEIEQLKAAGTPLALEVGELRERVAELNRLLQSQADEAEAERLAALERQRIELSGTLEEREALRKEEGKAERIELLRRQVVRRMKFGGLTHGWNAWCELAQARSYALGRLREISNRLRKPELSFAFDTWGSLLVEKYESARQTEVERLRLREQDLQAACEQLKSQLALERNSAAAALQKAETDKASALKRQLVQLTGTAEEMAALEHEKSKEERIELLRRQCTRRMLNRGIAIGWQCWFELWDAKTYAMNRLRDVGNRFRAPELANAFRFWGELVREAKRNAQFAELERQSKSVEHQLRQVRFEVGQAELVRVANRDEIQALKSKLSETIESLEDRDARLSRLLGYEREADELRNLHQAAIDAQKLAEQRQLEAEEDNLRQREADKQLLERLLAEQRSQFDTEQEQAKKQIKRIAEERKAYEKQISELGKSLNEQQASSAATQKELQAQVDALKAEVAKLKRPPPVKKKEEAKGKPSPLGNFDLDEGPDAPPISQQLADALRKNSTRVLDLFRSWDADGDGEVTRKEFHKAMPNLGLDVPKESIDELFTEWDKDGGGALNLKELQKILSQARVASPAAQVQKAASTAVNALAATKVMAKLAKK